MVEKYNIVITEIFGYTGKNKRHAELQKALKKYIKLQKHHECAQWVDRDAIKAWYLPMPFISYEEYATLKANIGTRSEYINNLYKKIKWIKQEIKKCLREYSLNLKKNENEQ